MTTSTLTTARRTPWSTGVALGSLAGLALAVGGVWNALVQEHVTVPPVPDDVTADAPPLQAMHSYYAWYAGTVAQERAVTIVGLAGVVGLVLMVAELRTRMVSTLGRCACTTLQAGAVLWVVGSVADIGGHRAVGLMATHGNPIETVNAIAFTTDITNDAFSTAAFALLAVGMVGLATTTFGAPRWVILSGFIGVLAALVAYGYMAGSDAITTYVLALVAAVLTPAWLLWTGRLLDGVRAPTS